jgi:hypothetical protein
MTMTTTSTPMMHLKDRRVSSQRRDIIAHRYTFYDVQGDQRNFCFDDVEQRWVLRQKPQRRSRRKECGASAVTTSCCDLSSSSYPPPLEEVTCYPSGSFEDEEETGGYAYCYISTTALIRQSGELKNAVAVYAKRPIEFLIDPTIATISLCLNIVFVCMKIFVC